MALLLSRTEEYDVLGVVLIKTIYPGLVQRVEDGRVDESDLIYGNIISKVTQTMMIRALNEADEAAKRHEVRRDQDYPPIVLIKADEPMPYQKTENVPPMLGSNEDGLDLVRAIYRVPGHHYSVFKNKNVPTPAKHTLWFLVS